MVPANFLAMTALQLWTHLACDGGWSRIRQPWDAIELFSKDAHVSLAVSSAGEPYDGGPGNSLRTRAAQGQLFQDVESWKPRLIVDYLSYWTPGASELALELVRRQRAGDVRFSSGIHSTPRCHCPLVTSRRDSIWSTELWMVGLQTPLKRRHDFSGWSIGCVQQEANVSKALVSFFERHEKSFMCPRCESHIRTHPDPDGNVIRRHQVGPKRPSSSDTRNQDGLETSSHESWTSHQGRSDQVLGWRQSRSTKGSEMFTMLKG